LGETSVKELLEPFSLSAPSITKHLKVLERAGLIRRSRDAQRRPCRLEAAPLQEVSEWVERYRSFWEHSLSRLDDYLARLEAKETKKMLVKGSAEVTVDSSVGPRDRFHSHLRTSPRSVVHSLDAA